VTKSYWIVLETYIGSLWEEGEVGGEEGEEFMAN